MKWTSSSITLVGLFVWLSAKLTCSIFWIDLGSDVPSTFDSISSLWSIRELCLCERIQKRIEKTIVSATNYVEFSAKLVLLSS